MEPKTSRCVIIALVLLVEGMLCVAWQDLLSDVSSAAAFASLLPFMTLLLELYYFVCMCN